MKKRWVICTIAILGMSMFLYLGIFRVYRDAPSSQPAPNQNGKSYFDLIPITKWVSQCPCLLIQIDGNAISCELDLGFRGHFSIASEILDRIEEKTYLGSQKMYGFRGKEYEKSIFRIPEVQIGSTSFFCHEIQEEAPNFHINGTTVKDGGEPSPAEPGRIGWKIFQDTNLLLDLRNQRIAFCDSLSTLKSQGYKVESFVKTPLIIERGFLEIDTNTSNGHLRCILDTGCTWNVLNTAAADGKSIDELVWHPDSLYEMPLFKIAEREFGPITFRRFPIQIPIHVEAILGMEFLKDNVVFLDFAHNFAYFAPSDLIRHEL